MRKRFRLAPLFLPALLLSAGSGLSGCGFKDSAFMAFERVSQSADIKTVDGPEFTRLVEQPNQYPHFWEYRGIRGSYHFLYEYNVSKTTGLITLQTIYRTRKDNLSKDFKTRYLQPDASWYPDRAPEAKKADDATTTTPEPAAPPPEETPRTNTVPGIIPNVGGF